MDHRNDYNNCRERLFAIFDGERATFADRINIINFIDNMHDENANLKRTVKRRDVRLCVNADLDVMPETVIVKNIREGKEQISTSRMREVTSYEEGYADGFDCGGEAVVQQVDGILDDSITSNEAVRRVRRWIEDFWKERES